jgi:polyisoprenoid-binding protein YceI
MASTSPMTHRIDRPPAGRYRLDPGRCQLGFRTGYLFGLVTVTGTMQVSSGESLIEDPEVPQAHVTARIDASSFATGNHRRDDHVRSATFLHAEAYPQLTYRAGALNQVQGRWTLTGELTVRDVTSPVPLTIESVQATSRDLRVHATGRIDRYAFGVKAAGGGMIARFLDLDLYITAKPR